MTTIRENASGNKFIAVYEEIARIKKEEAKRFEKTLIFRKERDAKRNARKKFK